MMKKMLLSIKQYATSKFISINTMTKEHPLFSGIAVILLFYVFAAYASKNVMVIDNRTYATIIVVMLITFYTTYMMTKLKSETLTTRQRKFNNGAFTVLSIISVVAFAFYDPVIGTLLPSLYASYNKSQILLWTLVTPVTEELVFRYLFYDKWALSKFKKPIAMLLVLIVFVLLHPVTNMQTFVMYLLPALLLFMTYDMGGIYASIAVHMIFNTLSLL